MLVSYIYKVENHYIYILVVFKVKIYSFNT